MAVKIALAGNPNSGKTTLFNALTGQNQFVGNWPGVTVEKKEGRLKGYADVTVIDLPGIYSLSPYTLEEVVARNYLLKERPDVILNIVDGTNLERNLYLSTQLLELGIPVVMAVNMADILEKTGDRVHIGKLSQKLGCAVMGISALKGSGIWEAAKKAVSMAGKQAVSMTAKEAVSMAGKQAVSMTAKEAVSMAGKQAVSMTAREAVSMAGERDGFHGGETPVHLFSPQAERAVEETEGLLGNQVPQEQKRFFAVKLLEGDAKLGDALNHLPDVSAQVQALEEAFDDDVESIFTNERYAFISSIIKECCTKKSGRGKRSVSDKIDRIVTNRWLALPIFAAVMFVVYGVSVSTVGDMLTGWTNDTLFAEWIVPGVAGGLEAIGCAGWLAGLVADGIVGGVGAVLGFVPQMLVLFLFLAFLEACGYMARVAFIMDRMFRKFGLSGKSFIPMLIGSGCGVPGILASRTVENDRDRRMTVITTTFVPCGAKLPIIGMIAGAFFGNAGWVSWSAYFIGIAAIICSGVILKKTRMFAGDPAPFVMELPAYHMPTLGNVLRSMWERGWSFIKKAGTIILLSTIVLWFLQGFGWVEGSFTMLEEGQLDHSILAAIGGLLAPVFAPLGWGGWRMAVAAVTGLVAKENVAATFGILFGFAQVAEDGEEIWSVLAATMTGVAAYSFLVFNLLCAPCFAAMGAIKREMGNAKWFWFAIGYQCGIAYAVSLCIYQLGSLFTTGQFGVGTVFAVIAVAVFLYLLLRPYKEGVALQVDRKHAVGVK